MMKHILCLSITLLLLFSAFGCAPQEKDTVSDFFLWTDGYIAIADGTSYPFSLSYYYQSQNPPLDPEEITQVYIPGVEPAEITVSDWSFNELQTDPSSGYQAWGMTFDLTFSQEKLWEIRDIGFSLTDGTALEYPVGTLLFDVGPASDPPSIDEVDIWSSTAATGSSNTYPYKYPLGENSKLLKLTYWADVSIEDSNGLQESGALPLTFSEAPLKVVQPRLEVQIGTERQVVYGNICWCGSLTLSPDDLAACQTYTASRRSGAE